jgi:hypothetical protein
MALQELGYFALPPIPRSLSGSPQSVSNITVDLADEIGGGVYLVPKTGNITKVWVRFGTVTTGATLDVRLETIGSDGNPSGTLVGTTTNASLVLASSDDDKWIPVTLTAAAAVTRGDHIAAVVVNPSSSAGTFNLPGASDDPAGGESPNYGVNKSGGSWLTKLVVAPSILFEYSDGFACAPGFVMVAVFNSTAFTSASAADEIGNRFTLPFPARVGGAWFYGIGSSGSNGDLVVYEGTTAIATGTIKSVERAGLTALYYVWFATPANLSANTVYRVVLKPGATGNATIYDWDLPVATDILDVLPGGKNCYGTSRVDAGSWTDDTDANKRYLIGVFLDAFDDGAGGSGGGGPLVGGRLVR